MKKCGIIPRLKKKSIFAGDNSLLAEFILAFSPGKMSTNMAGLLDGMNYLISNFFNLNLLKIFLILTSLNLNFLNFKSLQF